MNHKKAITLDRVPELGKTVTLSGEALSYLAAWKPRLGGAFTLTAPVGDYRARLVARDVSTAELFVFEKISGTVESPLEMILLQALPERERMELIIEKATELGADLIVPFKAERGVSLAERDAKQDKSRRWPERALKAARQCRRAGIPAIAPFQSLETALDFAETAELRIALWEKANKPLREVMTGLDDVRSVAVLVGPEGGLTDEEMETITSRGFTAVTLGGRVLRTETAAIAAMALLQYTLGDLGRGRE